MDFVNYTEQIPRKDRFDVVVAGGGVAGVAAALSARRMDKTVLLLEKSFFLGGLATSGLINFFVPMCNGRGKRIIRGMVEELLQLAIRYGYDTIPKDWKNGEPREPTKQCFCSKYSPQIFALAMTELVAGEGIDLRFDAQLSQALMQGGHCEGVIVQTKSGREFYEGSVFIDCTGDADLLSRAGVPTVTGKNYFTYIAHMADLESCRRALDAQDIGKLVYWQHGGTADLYGHRHPEEMKTFTGTSGADVAEFLILNQRELFRKIKNQPRKSRDIVTLPGMPQFRTSCRIIGDYTLQPEDAYRHFEDSVGAINDFDRRDYLFEAPYRTMVRSGYDNLLTAGRCTSGEGYAWDVLRVIPPAIVTGQAAGIAAALAIDRKEPVFGLAVSALQDVLKKVGTPLHFDDEWIPAVKGPDEPMDDGEF